jgi:hypothetical protein
MIYLLLLLHIYPSRVLMYYYLDLLGLVTIRVQKAITSQLGKRYQ